MKNKNYIKTSLKSLLEIVSDLSALKGALSSDQQKVIDRGIEAVFVKCIQEFNAHQSIAIFGSLLPLEIEDKELCKDFMDCCTFSVTQIVEASRQLREAVTHWPENLKEQIKMNLAMNQEILARYEKLADLLANSHNHSECNCGESH